MPRQPYKQTVADFVRSQGWKPGDVIAGREGGHIAVLRIVWVGDEIVVFRDLSRTGEETSAWTLTCRYWERCDPEEHAFARVAITFWRAVAASMVKP